MHCKPYVHTCCHPHTYTVPQMMFLEPFVHYVVMYLLAILAALLAYAVYTDCLVRQKKHFARISILRGSQNSSSGNIFQVFFPLILLNFAAKSHSDRYTKCTFLQIFPPCGARGIGQDALKPHNKGRQDLGMCLSTTAFIQF